MNKKCPIYSIGENDLTNCLEEDCAFYDENYNQCAIMTIAKSLGNFSECVVDNRYGGASLSVDAGN